MSAVVGSNTAKFETYVNTIANRGLIGVLQTTTSFSINGIYSTGAFGTPEGGISTKIGTTLANFSGPVTYSCNSNTGSKLSYYCLSTPLSMVPATDINIDLEGGTAKVIVTAFDPIAKTISGSFSGTLVGKTPRNQDLYSQELSNRQLNIRF